MKLSEIIKINEKGEILIPDSIRKSTGIIEGMHVLIQANIERKEIHITPFSTIKEDLIEFKITLADIPSALANCATFLGKHKVNLVASESRTIEKDQLAEWIVIADISHCNNDMRELCAKLNEEGYTKGVSFKKLQ